MFRSPRILSPVPSRAELAGTITTADEISVDCTKYGCSRYAILNITSLNEFHAQCAVLLIIVCEESFIAFHINPFPTWLNKPICLDVSQPWKFRDLSRESRKFSYRVSMQLVSCSMRKLLELLSDLSIILLIIHRTNDNYIHFFSSAALIN